MNSQAKTKAEIEATPENLENICLLMVEDDQQMRKMLHVMLSEIGINQVFMAKDGAEALTFLGDCEDMINAVFCDWNMPNMSGVELLRQVRSVNANIPFVMITGRKDESSILEAKTAGISGYITKPFYTDELERKIRAIAKISELRKVSIG